MKKKWICTVCGYVHEGDEAPEFCPQCKQPKSLNLSWRERLSTMLTSLCRGRLELQGLHIF